MLNNNEKVIKHKVGLLNLAEELGNVSKACKAMGLSRDTFYRYKAAVEEVRSIWLRHGPANFKVRLNALESKVNQEGIILTESQIIALERKKHDDEASGEIDTAHPGYLGSQDTFYVGTLKGVGRVYQQTFVDTYSKVAFAKLYTTKTLITSADLLNDKVLPFFEQNELPMLRILTDRGTEFCGKAEQHDYELYLAINDIEHTKTKTQ
jgi:transposase InsO family protein